MLLKDFLIAQTAGAVALSWVDSDPDTASTPGLHGVEVRHHTAVAPDTDALPVILVRRDRPDHLLGQLERRPESSRLVVLTDLFLFEPAVEKLVAEFAVAGCQLLHAVEIEDAAEVDVFSAFALQRRSTPLQTTGPSAPDLETAGLVTLRRSTQEGEHGSVGRLRSLIKDRDQARRDLRRANDELHALRASTAMQVGRAAVDAVRVPRTGLPRLPQRLLAAWRSRPAMRATDDRPGKATGAASSTEVPMLEFSLALPVPPLAGEREVPRELTFAVPTSSYVARVLQRDGLRAFEPDMLPWFLALCETARPGAVWDVGANIGIYALLARAYTEREVVGFEPTPAVRDWGRRVAADNGLAYCFEQVAVGEAAGTAVLYLSDRTDSSNSLAAGFRPSSRRIEVLVETLDRHQELTNSSPAIVKITEHLVLRGARRILAEHRPWIFCEVLVNREPARVLTEIMDGTGYRYYQLTGDRAPVERQTITGDPSNPHPNYLLAPVEPRRAAPRASGSTRPGRRCNLPFMKRSARRHRTARHAISRDDPRFAAGVVLVLGCLAVMVLYVAAVVARTIVRPESGPLVDILALLDAGQERTLASWWTGALLLTASAAAALVGHLTATASGRSREVVAWRVLAVLLALLSLDEIVALHERGNRWTAAAIDADSVLTRLGWLLPASVVLVVSMGVLIPMFLALPRRPRNVVAAGLATSVGGAMGLEFVDVVLINAEAELRWRYLAMALEEAAEMAGILIMLLGISMAVRIVRTGGRLTISTLHAEAARDHATATPVESPEASADRSVTVTTP